MSARLATALLLAAGAVAGCSGGSSQPAAPAPAGTEAAVPGTGGVQTVTVRGDDKLMFAPTALTARTGALRVVFTNTGSIAHTFRIKGVEPDTGNVSGHASDTITVMLTHAGTYYFECDYHPTMVGTLDVS